MKRNRNNERSSIPNGFYVCLFVKCFCFCCLKLKSLSPTPSEVETKQAQDGQSDTAMREKRGELSWLRSETTTCFTCSKDC
jgi:hypothetical protein